MKNKNFTKVTKEKIYQKESELKQLSYDSIPFIDNRTGDLFFINKSQNNNYLGLFYAMKPERWWHFIDLHLGTDFEVIANDFLIEIEKSYTARENALQEIKDVDDINIINYERLTIQIINHVFFIEELPKPVLNKLFVTLFSFERIEEAKNEDFELEHQLLSSITKEEIKYAFEDNAPTEFYNIKVIFHLLKYIDGKEKSNFAYKLLIILKNSLIVEKQEIADPFAFYYTILIMYFHKERAFDDMSGYNLAVLNDIIPLLSNHIFKIKFNTSTPIAEQIDDLKRIHEFENTFNISTDIENYTEVAEYILPLRKLVRLFDELQ